MVGPSITDEERQAMNRWIKAGFVVLVGVSGGLVALQLGPTLPQLGAIVAGSLLLGGVLVWYLTRLAGELQP